MLWDESELSNSIREKSLRQRAWSTIHGWTLAIWKTLKSLSKCCDYYGHFSSVSQMGQIPKRLRFIILSTQSQVSFTGGKAVLSFLWWLLHNEASNCPLFNICYLYLSAPHTLYLYVWKKGSSLCTCIPHGGESLSPQCASDLVLKWCSSESFQS